MAHSADVTASAQDILPNKPTSDDAGSPTSSRSSPQSITSSIFSQDDGRSSQSSAPSCSPDISGEVWDNGTGVSLAQLQLNTTSTSLSTLNTTSTSLSTSADVSQTSSHDGAHVASSEVPVLRHNPRRTSRRESQGQQEFKPPPFIRQCERKEHFVDGLVDTATEMIETIWPLSSYSCGAKIASTEAEAKNVSGLRTYVQELLKRSRTSYSTLQVALYYLILIQSFLPKQDLTKEQTRESHKRISLQCGRRMFLSALILAGKYLQDKSYSSRAWSKISGLGCTEINFNESEFLKAIGWRLHLPEELFTRWTDIVFKYSPARRSQSQSTSPASINWKALIPRLTPKLNNVELFSESGSEPSDIDSGYESSSSKESSLDSPPLRPYAASMDAPSQLDEEISALPSTLEPTPYDYTYMTAAPPPPVPSLGFLPTPVLTPANCNISTPAVSAYSANSRRSSMSLAMNDVRRSSLTRCTLDRIGSSMTIGTLCHGSRRSSLQHQIKTASPTSAPMDLPSTRVNSMPLPTTSHRAMAQPRSARPAARRCVTLSSWVTGQEQVPASMAFEDMHPLPVRPGTTHTPVGKLPQSNGDKGHKSSAAENVDYELVAFLNRNANQRRVAESHLSTPPKAPAQRASRKRERPLSMDLSNTPAIREALTPSSESSYSETSSNSSTPRPPTANRGSEIVVVDDDHVISTPVACSAASTLAHAMPNDLVSTIHTVKPAKKVQKMDKLYNFSVVGDDRQKNQFHASTAQIDLLSQLCSIQAAASTLTPSRRGFCQQARI